MPKLGLLICDELDDDYVKNNGDYAGMFIDLLPGFDYAVFNVFKGEYPQEPSDCDCWLISGSRYSAYEDSEWIHRLISFIQTIQKANLPCVGVCFGHQIIAEALGGKVEKAPIGWCVGVHTFQIESQSSWMSSYQPQTNILMVCQDQVFALPPNSEVLASSDDCKIAMYQIGDKILGIQGHPELKKDYVQLLIEKRAEKIGEEKVKSALKSLDLQLDKKVFANWIISFLNKK